MGFRGATRPALSHATRGAVSFNKQVAVEVGLLDIALSIEKMELELRNMLKRCSPEIYYNDIRPWLQSFKDIIFDGVSMYENRPQEFRGPSGAQSSSMPTFCAALGINYRNPLITQHFDELHKYISVKHREFIATIKTGPSIRSFVERHRRSSPNLKSAYNTCIHAIVNFRKRHFEVIQGYIHGISVGTGGTPLREWLELIINETEEHYL